MSIPTELLGRYECIEPSENMLRVWHIIHDLSRDIYVVLWGRMGNKAQVVEYDEKKALTKIRSKIKSTSKRPPYVKRDGYDETQGALSVSFIMSLKEEIENGSK